MSKALTVPCGFGIFLLGGLGIFARRRKAVVPGCPRPFLTFPDFYQRV